MPKVPLIALEIVLGFGVPLAWAAWELFDLRREREADRLKVERVQAERVQAERLGREASAATQAGAASETATSPAPRACESGPS